MRLLVVLLIGLSMLSADCSAESGAVLSCQLKASSTTVKSVADMELTAVITNKGNGAGTVNRFILDNPILALTVMDAKRQPMSSLPPPVPPLPEDMKKFDRVLKPGDHLVLKYQLNIFSRPLPDGDYLVRVDEPPSNELRFTIKSKNHTE